MNSPPVPPDFQAIASAWAQTAQNLATVNVQLQAELALLRQQLAQLQRPPVPASVPEAPSSER
jgi:hypothetical protein